MSTSVPPILQLAATLNLLASGSFQHNAGNDFLLGFGNVCAALHNICIKFKVPMYTNVNSTEPSSIEVSTGGETRLLKIGEKIRDQIKMSLSANI